MKLKTAILSLSISTILSSMAIVAPAYAGNGTCEAGDPCGNWAIVDSQGIVTSVIVCQQSVCGGGEYLGQKAVMQTAPNSETHDTTGTGGYRSTESSIVTESNGVFTMHTPHPITTVDNESGVITTVSVSETAHTINFRDPDGKNYASPVFTPGTPSENTSAEISVKDLDKEEKIKFVSRKSKNEIEVEMFKQQVNLIISKINLIIERLGLWVKK
jgi:hypothetical protein